MYGQMVLWEKKKKVEVCLNPDFYLMRSQLLKPTYDPVKDCKHTYTI